MYSDVYYQSVENSRQYHLKKDIYSGVATLGYHCEIKALVEKHNANIENIKLPESNSYSRSSSTSSSNSFVGNTESGSPNVSATSSGAYITHSYFGNCGNVITTCIG